jgi:kynurenine 3-monooxygenase
MMIALPNRDGSFTCTLFWPYEGEHSFARLEGPVAARVTSPTREQRRAVEAFFEEHYRDFVPLSPGFVSDFFSNPTSSLVTVRCEPWQMNGTVCLLGDAAHAIVPFYGQGMNAAFEDCVCLARALKRHADQREALLAYQAERKPNADAIADMALENFIEMRDLAGRSDFQYRKRIEQTLHRALGDAVLPQYNLVSFSTVPYALAQRRGREMSVILHEIADLVPPGGDPRAWEQNVIAAGRARAARLTPIAAGGAS